jgi:hypothetical protein
MLEEQLPGSSLQKSSSSPASTQYSADLDLHIITLNPAILDSKLEGTSINASSCLTEAHGFVMLTHLE